MVSHKIGAGAVSAAWGEGVARGSAGRRYIGFARRPAEEDEVDGLLAACRSWRPVDEGIVLLAADAGLRRAEVCACEFKDLSGERLHVPAGKGNVSRWTIVTPRLRAAVDCMQEGGRTGRVCGALGYNMLHVFLSDLRRIAGVGDEVCWHSLRHRFAMRLVMGGVPIHEVADLMGHQWLSSTARYLHVLPSRFSRAVDAVGDGFRESVAPSAGRVSEGAAVLRIVQGG